MRLVRKNELGTPKDAPVGIADAFGRECESDRDGAVERARDVAGMVADKLGRLVELLHNRGALKDADVSALLPAHKAAPKAEKGKG